MNKLFLEGLSDAAGFLAGVLLAYVLGRLVGVDPLAEGYGSSSIVGILMAGLGGGAGLQLARAWRHKRAAARADRTP